MVHAALDQLGEAAIEPLGCALHDFSWAIRQQAAEILGMSGSRKAIPELSHALQDTHAEVRFAAISALHNIGGIEAQRALKMAENDGDERVGALAKRAH